MSSRARRAQWRGRRWKLGLLVLVLLLGIAAISPYEDYQAASSRVDALSDRHAALTDEVVALEARSEQLSDPEEIELIAREDLGLVRPGEIPYVVEGVHELATTAPAAATPDEPPLPWWRQVLDRLGDLVG